MKKNPISVVICVLNGERFIGEAIKSVQAQTYNVDEIIVVNNNSTDNSVKIAEDLGATVIHESEPSLPVARNKGIKACRNDWVAILDCDDIWEKEKIELQWKAFERFPAARLIACDFEVFNEFGETKGSTIQTEPPELEKPANLVIDDLFAFTPKYTHDLCGWFVIHISGLICHREVFTVAGYEDEKFRFVDDVEFFHRALRHFPIVQVKKKLVRIRKHDQNMSSKRAEMMKYYVLAVEKMLKFPELYTPGIGQILLDTYKHGFLLEGKELADKMRESDNYE